MGLGHLGASRVLGSDILPICKGSVQGFEGVVQLDGVLLGF